MKKITTFLILIFGISVFAQIPNYVPVNGLIGWYPFNGNANDLSTSVNNGTLNNVISTTDRFNNTNSAYYFSQSNIGMPSNNYPNGNNPRSLSVWFNVPQLPSPGTGYVLLNYGVLNSNNACGIALQSNGISFFSWLSQNDLNGIVPVITNQWNNIIATYDGQVSKLYFNGNLISQANQQKNTIINYLSIGTNGLTNWNQNQYTIGKIDDIGIWNRALTACEINQLYTSSISTISIQASSNSLCAGQIATLNLNGSNSYTWSTGQNTSSIQISPTITTNYSVIGTATNICTPTAAINISVNPLPTISVNSGTICNSQSFTLIPNGANTYTISGGNTIVSPTTTTSYSVTGTSTAGCISASAAVATVSVNQNPILSITGNTLLCTGETGTITVSGANVYAWSNGATSTSITINNTPNTYNYTVTGTGTNSCTASTTVQVLINACTSIAQNQNKYLDIYPNPASSLLNIGANDQAIGKTLKIFDAQSKLIQVLVLNTNNVLQLSDWAKGIYLIQVSELGISKRIVIE